jgi:two-component system response regulator HydG
VIISETQLGDESGLSLCVWLKDQRPDLQVLMMTGSDSMEDAVAAMRAGAHDFIAKPMELDLIDHAVQRALSHRALTEELRELRRSVPGARDDVGIIGASHAVCELLALIDRVADGDATVLVSGESGTGKELVARALHRRSHRKTGPFVALNCAALPASLLESELFGHEKGAFTDARQARSGLLREADGGTLFLDEIGEMSTDVQVKLLRALQERQVRPIGGAHEVPFDARIVCATNRDLEAEVEAGRFREDFYYRINVVALHTPPLRTRGNDILLLAEHFIEEVVERTGKDVRGFTQGAAERLLAYDWPGNVRQLQNVVERAMALTRLDHITLDDLPERVVNHKSTDIIVSSDDVSSMLPLAELEKRYVERVLSAVGGNKAQAAKVLGLDRRTLYRKLERWQ